MELVGARGVVKILADICPRVYARNDGPWTNAGRPSQWQPIEGDPTAAWTTAEKSVHLANRRVVDDWLDAIQTNRQPACSGETGAKALEMAMAVFEAGLSGNRVKLPMANRAHPLMKPG
jgi:predicted dehydrogenase